MRLFLAAGGAVALALGWNFTQMPMAMGICVVLLTVAMLCILLAEGSLLPRMAMTALTMLMAASYPHLARGMVEARSGFFLVLAMLLVYCDWRPIALGAALAIAYHIATNDLAGVASANTQLKHHEAMRSIADVVGISIQATIEIWIAIKARPDARTVKSQRGGAAHGEGFEGQADKTEVNPSVAANTSLTSHARNQ